MTRASYLNMHSASFFVVLEHEHLLKWLGFDCLSVPVRKLLPNMRLQLKCSPYIFILLSLLILLFIRGAWRKNNKKRSLRERYKVDKKLKYFEIINSKNLFSVKSTKVKHVDINAWRGFLPTYVSTSYLIPSSPVVL